MKLEVPMCFDNFQLFFYQIILITVLIHLSYVAYLKLTKIKLRGLQVSPLQDFKDMFHY